MSRIPKTDKELDDLLNRLASSTHSPQKEFSAGNSYNKLEKNIIIRKPFRRKPYKYVSIAAAIILILGFSWMYWNSQYSADIITIQTLAETKTISLPDGTKVILNHFSSLSYPEKFSKNTRSVELSGEGYFEVAKNPEKPFTVTTEEIKVRVLGTHFNINAYSNNPDVTTTLLEGKVEVTDKNNTDKITLKPNETAIYDKVTTTLVQQKDKNPQNEIAWCDGNILFDNVPLKEIARELSNRFGVDIQVADSNLQDFRLTARFTDKEELIEILELLQNTGNFTIEQTTKTIRLKTKLN